MSNPIILHNVANWHADEAFKALKAGKEVTFARHILICDRLRRKARVLERASVRAEAA